ncbi:MAG: AAA family ATPase [Planctomycetota bacterium]|nr:AAA family ATPase [Planctomycetota bacterium]
MINRVQLVRNIGRFDSVAVPPQLSLARLTLIYAENGRGKTTLAAILRSLASGDPLPITERRRLSATNTPHVVLECDGGPPNAMFQAGAWNRSLPNIAVFDDIFVDENVCSGLSIDAEHRRGLHELILGARGVELNRALQDLVARIEVHNTALRTRANAIPTQARGPFTVEDYCALTERPDIATEIRDTERRLSAAQEQEAIRTARQFDTLTVPTFDVRALESLLARDLAGLDQSVVARVQAHLATLGPEGGTWVSTGMRLQDVRAQHAASAACPFCDQDITQAPILQHYRAYFGEGYRALTGEIASTIDGLARTHGGEVPAGFERSVRVLSESRQFWARFCDVPEITLDTADLVSKWRDAREAILAALRAKQAAPLDPVSLSAAAREAIAHFESSREAVLALNASLAASNAAIALVKEQATTADAVALRTDLARLNATRTRFDPAIRPLCVEYLREAAEKARSELARDTARADLDNYRSAIFPAYEAAINTHLQRFGAGFCLTSVVSTNTRGGSACTYSAVINNTPVPVTAADPAEGEPSFRSTLSAGDRNTLALAFFFASLEQAGSLADRIVVIDDPISSLDEHRALTTVQEMRRLLASVRQLIVLSHSKPFLCSLWVPASPTERAGFEIARDGTGSTIRAWDVNQDCVTEHDRRDASIREYVERGGTNSRSVAHSLRPHLEAFCRVAYPQHFQPGQLLGPFRSICEQRLGTPSQLLNAADVEELRRLTEYANRFHHDTNLACDTERINDQELADFARRTIAFTRRP